MKSRWQECRLVSPASLPDGKVPMNLQEISGSDDFDHVHWTQSDDLEKTWTESEPISAPARAPVKRHDGRKAGVCDVTPSIIPTREPFWPSATWCSFRAFTPCATTSFRVTRFMACIARTAPRRNAEFFRLEVSRLPLHQLNLRSHCKICRIIDRGVEVAENTQPTRKALSVI